MRCGSSAALQHPQCLAVLCLLLQKQLSVDLLPSSTGQHSGCAAKRLGQDRVPSQGCSATPQQQSNILNRFFMLTASAAMACHTLLVDRLLVSPFAGQHSGCSAKQFGQDRVPGQGRDAAAGQRSNLLQRLTFSCLSLQKQWLATHSLTCLCPHLQASIVDVLQSDLAKIESLVRDAMRQLSSAATSSSVRPLDACEVMEAMNRHHLQELLPRLEQADTSFEQLCGHCLDCKVCKFTSLMYASLHTVAAAVAVHSWQSHKFDLCLTP